MLFDEIIIIISKKLSTSAWVRFSADAVISARRGSLRCAEKRYFFRTWLDLRTQKYTVWKVTQQDPHRDN